MPGILRCWEEQGARRGCSAWLLAAWLERDLCLLLQMWLFHIPGDSWLLLTCTGGRGRHRKFAMWLQRKCEPAKVGPFQKCSRSSTLSYKWVEEWSVLLFQYSCLLLKFIILPFINQMLKIWGKSMLIRTKPCEHSTGAKRYFCLWLSHYQLPCSIKYFSFKLLINSSVPWNAWTKTILPSKKEKQPIIHLCDCTFVCFGIYVHNQNRIVPLLNCAWDRAAKHSKAGIDSRLGI